MLRTYARKDENVDDGAKVTPGKRIEEISSDFGAPELVPTGLEMIISMGHCLSVLIFSMISIKQ